MGLVAGCPCSAKNSCWYSTTHTRMGLEVGFDTQDVDEMAAS